MDDSLLSRAVLHLASPGILESARRLVESDAVFAVTEETRGDQHRVEAVVASADSAKWYERATVETSIGPDGSGTIEARCTCGAGSGCVHAAATILASGHRMVGGLPGTRRAREAPQVHIGTSTAQGDWFDLKVTVTIEDEHVDFSELFAALSRGDTLFALPSGTYFPLDSPELDEFRRIIEEAANLNDSDPKTGSVHLSRYQSDMWAQLSELGLVSAREHQWWRHISRLSGQERLGRRDPPANLAAELRDYQLDGYTWLSFLYEHQLGGILADEMGLGKTLQALAMIQAARNSRPQDKPFLILAPTSVVSNWRQEAERFTPDLDVVVISETARKSGSALAEHISGADIVITSYALFRMEEQSYQVLDWSGLILDEAQMIKNYASRGYKAVRALRTPFTVVITGTPLENSLLELWALASLACPGLLGRRERFVQVFQTPIEKEHDDDRLATLRRRLKPFLLRRTKEAVASELPPKQEQLLMLDMHPTHRQLYDRRLQRERQKILGLVGNVRANRFEILRSLTLLRQLALDAELAGEGQAPSVKLEALGELLQEVTGEGHRVLVLSQFTRFLKKARAVADVIGIRSSYLDGATVDREQTIDAFRKGEREVFFISLKAGGFGLNLVEADYVVLLDPWWNPAAEAQAIDRTHRIGQTRPVMVYRLVAKDTVESKVMALQQSKYELFNRVLSGDGTANPGILSADDIRALME